MKHALFTASLGLLCVVWGFTPTSVYLQAIDRIIQKLVDNLESADYQALYDNIQTYNEHSSEFLRKLKAKDPTFRKIAIEHCRLGKPEFPDCVNINAFQLNLGWNDTQAADMFSLVDTTRNLWTAYNELCHDERYVRYLDKFTPDF